MKKFSIIPLIAFLFFVNGLSAQNDDDKIKHIHVVIQDGDARMAPSECVFPDLYGEVEITVSNIGIIVYNYEEVLANNECPPITLRVSDPANTNIEYASIVLDLGEQIETSIENLPVVCPDFYYFRPTLTFKVPSPCTFGNTDYVYLRYDIDDSPNAECRALMYPNNCYINDEGGIGGDHEDYVLNQVFINCCDEEAPAPPFELGDPIDLGGFNPRKAAATQMENFAVNLTPNPFNANFNIELESTTEESVQFNIFDGNNRLIYSQKESAGIGNNQYLIDGSTFADGFYYVKIQQGDRMEIRRLVKIQ